MPRPLDQQIAALPEEDRHALTVVVTLLERHPESFRHTSKNRRHRLLEIVGQLFDALRQHFR